MSTTGQSFGYCLNTSTIRGQELTVSEQLRIAAEAGYDGVELWVRELDQFVASGGSLVDVKNAAEQHGVSIAGLVAFFEWAVGNDVAREKGLEEAHRVFDMAAQLGCRAVAAPPSGLVKEPVVDPLVLAGRYREIVKIGRGYGVVPVLEFWGVSNNLGRLGETLFAAIECGEPEACILVDVYHMYKKGTPHGGIRLLNGSAIGMVHVNDYPADPPRETITDAHRVFPGDGVAPLKTFCADLRAIGYTGMLSLELFNESYWQMDALEAARTGLQKLKAVAE